MKENPYSNMDKEAYRIAYLIAGYIRNTLTEKEHNELDDWVDASDRNMELFEDLTDEKNLVANLEWMDKVQSDRLYQQLQAAGRFKTPAKRFKLNPVWIAAASVILLIGAFFIYRAAGDNTNDNNKIAISDTSTLQPGGNRATLTLEDGSIIDLALAKNGLLTTGNSSHVNKPADGEIVYELADSKPDSSAIHTLSTPVGGQFQVKLPDGTKVWLNAATIIKYPSQFSTNERNVELEGEAFFEVTKNEKQPFQILLADSSGVTVLGTHFNVMSYDNEAAKEITLLEGSVMVKSRNKTAKLDSGLQAKITKAGITKENNADMEQITGWKNGVFVFHDASIESIMRQVERWYGAKVIYQGAIKHQFNATILRSEPLSRLLHLLELNGYVHFKIENKTVYVLP